MASREIQDTFHVQGLDIRVVSSGDDDDYISLTDLAKHKTDDTKIAIANWMRLKDTIELLGIWEKLHNPNFKGIEFDTFKNQAGLNAFTMTPTKWIQSTNAIGIRTKRGRYGSGTFAHVDIALDFATWISPEFRLYVFQEYRHLKADEASRINKQWQEKRLFASMNYRIHTDAIKETMNSSLPERLQKLEYAKEGDLLNLAVFGMTAKEWRSKHPKEGNLRDNATTLQNLVLSNLENLNAMLMRDNVSRKERLIKLTKIAQEQMQSLSEQPTMKKLNGGTDSTSQIEQE